MSMPDHIKLLLWNNMPLFYDSPHNNSCHSTSHHLIGTLLIRLIYGYAIHICCQNIRIANLSRCYHVDGATNTLFGTLPKAVIPPTLPSVLHTISSRDMHRAIISCLLVLIATCFTSSSTSSCVSPLTTRIKMQL